MRGWPEWAVLAEAALHDADKMRLYKAVAEAYPAEHRSDVNTWEVHAILRGHPDRWEIVKEPLTTDQAILIAQMYHQVDPGDDRIDSTPRVLGLAMLRASRQA